ncbi:MAG: orotidine-5'-phosphate decarboxylase [Beijerinckiaceae bacterium]|nr:orotidine-5'-phosphate decarboxylase [Beijerinckiaceae bacterium]
MDLRERVIIALDLPDVPAAQAMVDRLGDQGRFYKIGYELAFVGGIDLAKALIAAGKHVFLDLKLHDIPNTIEKGVSQIAGLGARFLTVHAYPQTMRAAAKGAAGSSLTVLGVSVLTSMDDADLVEAGYARPVAEMVPLRARQVMAAGIGGLVCSATDIGVVRAAVGPDLLLVTPGIRPAGDVVGDQKRIMTPQDAIRAGADHLVIGRPITASADPAGALARILDDLATTA